MTIGELAEAASSQARADGPFRRYSFRQPRNALPSSRRFKWTSRSTYGLAEWVIGRSDQRDYSRYHAVLNRAV